MTTHDPLPHLGWAEKLARQIAREYHFRKGGQEEDDLLAVAALHLVRCSQRYSGEATDVDHFRGYAYLSITAEVRREARRLRNAGTYWVRKEVRGEVMDVPAFSDLSTESGEPFDTPARQSEGFALWA